MKEKEIIDHLNYLRAQDLALTQALAVLVQLFPDEMKTQLRSLYDMRCATYQNIWSIGKMDLPSLQMQREQFEKIRDRVFHE